MVTNNKQSKKLTAEHIKKIKQTYHKKEIDKLHSKIMQKYWADQRHKFNTEEYRKKLAKAKLGTKNPNSLLNKIKKMKR